MARAHQYVLNYRLFRRHMAEIADRFTEAEREKVEFALAFAGDISKVVDYLIADADAVAAFETDQIVLVDLSDPVLARRLIENARAHELFHRLGDQGFDEMLGLIDSDRDEVSISDWRGVLMQCAAMAGSQIGVCAMLRAEIPKDETVEVPASGRAPRSGGNADAPLQVEVAAFLWEVENAGEADHAEEDPFTETGASESRLAELATPSQVIAPLSARDEDPEPLEEPSENAAIAVIGSFMLAEEAGGAREDDAEAVDQGADAPGLFGVVDAVREPLSAPPAPPVAIETAPAPPPEPLFERPRELVLWNVGAGSAQLFVEVAYKLIQERLPDLAGYFDLLKRLSTGERTRKSAIEELAEASYVRSIGARWRVFWF